MTNVVQAAIDASASTGVERFILESSYLVDRARLTTGARMLRTMMTSIVDDKTASEMKLENSALLWTIVRPTILGNQRVTAGARLVPPGERVGLGNRISRADVATWILDECTKNEHVNAEVLISE